MKMKTLFQLTCLAALTAVTPVHAASISLSPADAIRLLAEIDTLHGTLSGSITRKPFERAFKLHHDVRCALVESKNAFR